MKKTCIYPVSLLFFLFSTAATAKWDGNWVTTIWNEMSVCHSSLGYDVAAGPIWNNDDAKRKCPAVIEKAEQQNICRNYVNNATPNIETPSESQPSNSISAKDYNLPGDAGRDNLSQLKEFLTTAKSQGKIAWFPAGTYNHSDVLVIDGMQVQGAGHATIFNATNPDKSAIKLTGSQSSIINIKTTVSAPSRSSMPDAAAILIQNAAGARVGNMFIQGASSNGVRIDNSSGAMVANNLVVGTNADGIAIMNGSTENKVTKNIVTQAADDSYSDDSYKGDQRQDEFNVFDGNVSLNNAYGRGICLAGSKKATVKNNIVSGSKWYGIYADADTDSGTMQSSEHIIQDNTVINPPSADTLPVLASPDKSPGTRVTGTKTTGSLPDLKSILGWDPGNIPDRYSFTRYQPGTGSGANNSGGNRS
ncbi:MAG: right-handed parallel beta-helix repeat-containing protein [Pseudomonadota bacterium]